MEQVKEQRPFCSLSKSQRDHERERDLERRYTASSTDREGACRVPTQKSYSSSETLQAYDHDPARLLFSGRVKEMAYQETNDYGRPGQGFSLRQLGICEPSTRRGLALCPETGLSHPLGRYSRRTVPTENHEPTSPERTMALWGRGAKSGQSSCLSSRSNSALTITDTEIDNKSDNEIEDRLSSQQGQPPLPPDTPTHHKQHPSITSLSRGSLANQRSLSPPPSAGLAAELQSTAECVQLQDSWVLDSNVALESRHFLFKTGTGTTPFFSTPTPGYTMATGAVYSTPARPLPRNTLSRGAFKLKKSPKHCSWRCTALSAVGVAVLLSIILCYCIAMHFFGLNWQLQETENQPTFENGGVKTLPTQPNILTPLSADYGRNGAAHQENSSVDTGQVEVGRRVSQGIPPGVFWRSRLAMEHPRFLKFNISVQKNALVGVYGRKGLPPSHTQYDFVELLDGSKLIAKERRASTEPEARGQMEHQVSLHQAGFIQYLDSGVWHLAFYNDGKRPETVSYNTIILESVMECSHNCYGNGECVSGSCHCFPRFSGPYCSRAACPILCSGNGQYARGRCQCYSGWKGTECDVPATQCVDPQCGGHGICVTGNCVCNAGHKGSNCHQGTPQGYAVSPFDFPAGQRHRQLKQLLFSTSPSR